VSRPRIFQRESLFRPKYVEHEVAGEALRFYPLSLSMLWKMKTAVEPMVQAFRALSSGKNDVEKTIDQGVDDQTGERRFLSHFGAVKPDLAAMREEKIEASLRKAVDAFFEPKMRDFVGELIADSLREEFTRKEARDQQVVRTFVDGNDETPGLDFVTLGQMVVGLAKANEGVFGPFAKQVREAMSGRIREILNDATGRGKPAAPDYSESNEPESDDWPESEQPEAEPSLHVRSD
jgi:hypothetical protein